jgi:hypothetical protein
VRIGQVNRFSSGGFEVKHPVFLSYSHEDRGAARRIAEILKATGISVNWDRDIPVGRDYQEVIEEMLAEASCAIVLWSSNSVKSKWVRLEATVAMEREILLPILIENVKIPFAFKLIQAEDFTDWTGDTQADAWRRLLLGIQGMIGAKRAELAPSEGRSEANLAASPTVGRPPAIGAFVTSLGLGLLAVVWVWGLKAPSAFFAGTIGVALLILLLFRTAERDISPRMRALATQWLLPRTGGVRVNTAEALNQLFEAIFGRDHFSSFCFVRSTFASATFLAMLLILARTVLGPTTTFNTGVWISLFLFGGAVNILGDYSSLYCTRIMLRLYSRGMYIGFVLASDFVITISIFLFSIVLGIFTIYYISVLNHNASMLHGDSLWGAVLRDWTIVVRQPYLDLYHSSSPEILPPGQQRLLVASAMTTFMTSIWLWAALLLSPVVRLIIWAGSAGLTTIGFIFDVHNTPFAAIGYLGALIVIMAGSCAWGASAVFAAIIR